MRARTIPTGCGNPCIAATRALWVSSHNTPRPDHDTCRALPFTQEVALWWPLAGLMRHDRDTGTPAEDCPTDPTEPMKLVFLIPTQDSEDSV